MVLRIKNPPFPRQKIWRQNGDKKLVSRFSNAEKPKFLIKKNASNSEELEALVREAGLEPARPEWTLEPESSESANSTTRAFAVFQLLGYITTDIPACQAEGAEKLRKTYRRIAGMTGRRRGGYRAGSAGCASFYCSRTYAALRCPSARDKNAGRSLNGRAGTSRKREYRRAPCNRA